MKVFGQYRSGTGEIRLAATGEKPSYRAREMSAEKREDIERCLSCTRKVCNGCYSTHEGRHAAARKAGSVS